MKREPLLKKGTWTALTSAVIVVLVAVGVPISSELKVAFITLVSTVAPIIVALWARPDVTPVADPRDTEGNPLLGGQQQ